MLFEILKKTFKNQMKNIINAIKIGTILSHFSQLYNEK